MKKQDDEKRNPQTLYRKKVGLFRVIEMKSADMAINFYLEVTENLKDINNWHKLTSMPSAEFQIMNEANQSQNRTIKEGDYVRIDIPGPGLPSAKGYDWVQVEKIIDEEHNTERKTTITLRPSSDPTNNDKDIAHFFKNIATSSLSIKLKDLEIVFTYAGRNEVINIDNESSLDNLRNFIIGLAAKMGASFPQWKALIDGLADISKKYKN